MLAVIARGLRFLRCNVLESRNGALGRERRTRSRTLDQDRAEVAMAEILLEFAWEGLTLSGTLRLPDGQEPGRMAGSDARGSPHRPPLRDRKLWSVHQPPGPGPVRL